MPARLAALVTCAILLSGCGDSSPGPGPTDPENIKKSQDEQNKAAAAEGEALKKENK